MAKESDKKHIQNDGKQKEENNIAMGNSLENRKQDRLLSKQKIKDSSSEIKIECYHRRQTWGHYMYMLMLN